MKRRNGIPTPSKAERKLTTVDLGGLLIGANAKRHHSTIFSWFDGGEIIVSLRDDYPMDVVQKLLIRVTKYLNKRATASPALEGLRVRPQGSAGA